VVRILIFRRRQLIVGVLWQENYTGVRESTSRLCRIGVGESAKDHLTILFPQHATRGPGA
jgi:hypothetical protein